MARVEREDIQIISRHSNWSEKGIDKILKQEIYNDKASWQKFLRLFFISLGVSFTTAGIVFFFAFNWADLHKFIKIGLIEGLLVITTLVVLFSNISSSVKNILLTGASILIGVLFAVFGQVYQTGANAYDLFLGWTLFIALWAAVSNFAPLWFVFITLINTTLILYTQQVAQGWSGVNILTLLFILNVLFLISFLFGKQFIKGLKSPVWFTDLLALAAVSFSTTGIISGIISEISGALDKNQTIFFLLIAIASILYAAGIMYGLKVKNSFYLSIIPLSIIIIIAAFLIKSSDGGAAMFFMVGVFVIASVTLVIYNLLNLQKKWIN